MDDIKSIENTLESLIWDLPVSAQLGLALSRMAEKSHTHDEYADKNKVDELSKKLDMLLDLVGDVPVAEQIEIAINKFKEK